MVCQIWLLIFEGPHPNYHPHPHSNEMWLRTWTYMCYVDYVSMYYESFYTFLSGYFTLLLRLNKKDIPIFTLLQEIEKKIEP